MKNINLKITVFFIFLFLTTNIISQETNFGEINYDLPSAERFQQFQKDGLRIPYTKEEERAMRKAKRLSLSSNEMRIINLKERGKELTFWQKIRFPFINRRYQKLQELQKQAKSQATGQAISNQTTTKYDLTVEEKIIMEKSLDSNVNLTKEEQKILKKAEKKQKKKDKFNKKNKIKPITDEEKDLVKSSKSKKDTLSKEQKKQVKKIKKDIKYNKKVKNKIQSYRIDSAYRAGAPLPDIPTKFKIKLFFQRMFSPKAKGPKLSSYAQKVERIYNRYTPTPKEKDAYNKAKSGAYITSIERYRARRANYKLWQRDRKTQKYLKKFFYDMQHKTTKKQIRKLNKQSEKDKKGSRDYRKKQSFLKLFKKRK